MDFTLTPRQQQILDFVRRHIAKQGIPPTRAEITTAFGFRSVTAAEDHLRALARKGVIELLPGASRGIRLTGDEDAAANDGDSLPLVGRVAAGNPILAQESVESWYKIDRKLFHPQPDFLLRVQGWSMRDAGILPGDLLAVKRVPTAQNGEIVVARMGEDVTVKRFERRGDIVRLLPANPDFAPIRIDLAQQDLVIEGRAVGLLRTGGFAGPSPAPLHADMSSAA
ncbi:MAG: transcriptional repressor LexA [Sinimarinibacterium flocculans]|uniref:LexA repressor n=1 Tax=Sinimarinibacterium flocculans TaxID=985250 RepID=A0A318E2G1_9GAMM|nr:transcriptional repressor LexA [Sinimarinibacterium flocculans]MEC9365106.1 transcriptional repressor LexA [Pseudomonadota bacterium]PXV65225.1 SOS-response transcriptional repressor LexA [Sinimarinibacterium flocculans]